jgi:phage terminase small subunit
MAKRDTLTPKQRRFLEIYLENGCDGSKAYRAAYATKASPRDVTREAAKLLKHPGIAPIVLTAERRAAEATNRVVDRFEVTAERIVSALARLSFYDARDIFEWSEAGVRLKPSDQITDDAAAAITEISQTETKDGGTLKVKLADKRASLVDLGKHLGMFIEKHEHKIDVGFAERLEALRQRRAARKA